MCKCSFCQMHCFDFLCLLQEKNVGYDSLEGKVGRIYMPKQDLNSMALNKMKVFAYRSYRCCTQTTSDKFRRYCLVLSCWLEVDEYLSQSCWTVKHDHDSKLLGWSSSCKFCWCRVSRERDKQQRQMPLRKGQRWIYQLLPINQ